MASSMASKAAYRRGGGNQRQRGAWREKGGSSVSAS